MQPRLPLVAGYSLRYSKDGEKQLERRATLMGIRPPDNVMAWLGPLVLINIFLWIVLSMPEAGQAVCGNSDTCLVDWVGALSGWAGAFGALIAAWWTVSSLRKQIEQQQLQIDFQLGDGPPTIQPLGKRGDRAPARFKIVNWNRRTISVTKIIAKAGDFLAPIVALEQEISSTKGAGEFSVRPDGTLDWKPYIEGWLDRSAAAPDFVFKIKYNEEDLDIFPPEPRQAVTIQVHLRAIGESTAMDWQIQLVMDRWAVFPISEAYYLEHDHLFRQGSYEG